MVRNGRVHCAADNHIPHKFVRELQSRAGVRARCHFPAGTPSQGGPKGAGHFFRPAMH